jgi:hypothetical protein
MDIVQLIIQLISGAVGSNAVGKAKSDFNLGAIINTIVGLLGGAGGGQLLGKILGGVAGAAGDVAGAAGNAAGGMDIGAILKSIGGGGGGGAILMAIVGMVMKMMNKPQGQ